jgi:diguanylate cyclase (GGDEF)-like protein
MRVLLVEDLDCDAELLAMSLRDALDEPPLIERAHNLAEACSRVAGDCFDVVLLDLSLPDSDGLDTLHSLHRVDPLVPIIVVGGFTDERTSLHAVQAGAEDYLLKGRERPAHIRRAIHHAIERKRASRRLHSLASLDSLTGIANRSSFQERVERAINHAHATDEKLALLFVDLDGFKSVNDSYGHNAGDALLREVAKRITRQVRRNDLVARVGGDEFTVLVEDLGSAADAAQIAEKLTGIAARPVTVCGEAISFGVSTGISIFPDHGSTLEELMQHSDEAMYLSKARGGNSFTLYSEHGDDNTCELEQAELQCGIAGGQFDVRYQPIVGVRSRDVVRYEALVRWHHPRHGLRHPVSFMPTVRRHKSLQLALDDYVVRHVCADVAHWHNAGLLRCPVSINVFGENVLSGEVHRLLQQATRATGCPTQSIELEINEDALLVDRARARDALQALRTMGVRICVDDLGATLSSLDYLRELPIDGLKLDRAFLRNLDNPHTCSIVRAIVSLGRSMHIAVTAGGVQTFEQEQFVAESRCHSMQGFRFGPAMPRRQVERRLNALLDGLDAPPARAQQGEYRRPGRVLSLVRHSGGAGKATVHRGLKEGSQH